MPLWSSRSQALSSAQRPSSRLQTTRRRVLVIANPAAGTLKQKKVNRTILQLERLGCTVALRETAFPGDGEAIARNANPAEFDVVVAAGGDGTINEVANGLAGRPIALGILPLGTANVMAIETGISRSPEKAAEVIATGNPVTVYTGQVASEAASPMGGPRRFVMMAGAGFDAHVVDTVDLALKRRTGAFAYVWGTLHKAFKYDFPPITVEVDGGPPQTGATVVVCKGAHYGGPFLGAPDADILDPSFQVVIMQRKGILNALRYGWGLVTGRFNKFPDVTIQKATHVRLSGPGALPLQGDGDTMAHLPVTISIAPEPVDVVMPV